MKHVFRAVGSVVAVSVIAAGCSNLHTVATPEKSTPVEVAMVKSSLMEGGACVGYGPQSPRDIDSVVGTNLRSFSLAPASAEMNLCNIHYHKNAEHKAAAFSILANDKTNGESGGYLCSISKSLSAHELRKPSKNFCKDVEPGDTLEVHWVHSSCDVTPGPSLGSCLSTSCANPDLRVETQVVTVVNDRSAADFGQMSYAGFKANGYHQPRSLPATTGVPVEFTGSTTGPKYTEQACSPLQVSWSVRPDCLKVDINSLSAWCESNVFEEDHAHGVRRLVTNPELLSPIQ